MKRLICFVAILGLSSAALAGSPPGDGLHGSPYLTTVPVKVTVGTITELYMDNTEVNLVIPDAGGVKGTGRAVKSVNYLSNVAIDVSLTLTGDIVDGTYFYVVVNPATPATWDYEFTGNHHAEKVISFLRQSGTYTGNQPGDVIPAFSRPVGAASIPIVYAAQIGPAGQVAAAGTASTGMVVTWTIAPQ